MIVLESSIITAIMNISYHYHCCHSCCCIIYLTLILNFFHLLSKWAFARYLYRSEYSPASCH